MGAVGLLHRRPDAPPTNLCDHPSCLQGLGRLQVPFGGATATKRQLGAFRAAQHVGGRASRRQGWQRRPGRRPPAPRPAPRERGAAAEHPGAAGAVPEIRCARWDHAMARRARRGSCRCRRRRSLPPPLTAASPPPLRRVRIPAGAVQPRSRGGARRVQEVWLLQQVARVSLLGAAACRAAQPSGAHSPRRSCCVPARAPCTARTTLLQQGRQPVCDDLQAAAAAQRRPAL